MPGQNLKKRKGAVEKVPASQSAPNSGCKGVEEIWNFSEKWQPGVRGGANTDRTSGWNQMKSNALAGSAKGRREGVEWS